MTNSGVSDALYKESYSYQTECDHQSVNYWGEHCFQLGDIPRALVVYAYDGRCSYSFALTNSLKYGVVSVT